MADFAGGGYPPAMPEHGLTEHHAKRHLINQSLKRRALAPRALKINVRPRPKVPVPITAVVPLHSKAERLAPNHPIIQRNLPRKNRITIHPPPKSNQPSPHNSPTKPPPPPH